MLLRSIFSSQNCLKCGQDWTILKFLYVDNKSKHDLSLESTELTLYISKNMLYSPRFLTESVSKVF